MIILIIHYLCLKGSGTSLLLWNTFQAISKHVTQQL